MHSCVNRFPICLLLRLVNAADRNSSRLRVATAADPRLQQAAKITADGLRKNNSRLAQTSHKAVSGEMSKDSVCMSEAVRERDGERQINR